MNVRPQDGCWSIAQGGPKVWLSEPPYSDHIGRAFMVRESIRRVRYHYFYRLVAVSKHARGYRVRLVGIGTNKQRRMALGKFEKCATLLGGSE